MMQILILAGGSGTRFWPLSRRSRPKQFLSLEGGASLLQQTVERVLPLAGSEGIWVSTTRELADGVRAQLPDVPPSQVLAEPTGRNTAPAIGWALLQMPEAVRSAPVAVLPADHRIADAAAFRDSLGTAREEVAASDRVMTLGVTPDRAETGYGYLQLREMLDAEAGLRLVERFTEKPDLATAERFLASGDYLWNAGIFVFRGELLLDLLDRLEPALGSGLRRIAEEPQRTDELYASLPSISIDYAVMEKLDDLGTLPLDCGWSDLGSWAALPELLDADADGNVLRGDAQAHDAADCLVWSDAGHVAVVGVDGLVVVRTADSVLVIPRDRAQEVRRVIERLREDGRTELL